MTKATTITAIQGGRYIAAFRADRIDSIHHSKDDQHQSIVIDIDGNTSVVTCGARTLIEAWNEALRSGTNQTIELSQEIET